MRPADVLASKAMSDTGLALAWFPAGVFEAALDRWPDLMDEPITDYGEYCAFIEGHLRGYAAAGSRDLVVAPIRLPEFLSWCDELDVDAGSPESRARYAAVVASRGEGVNWPPGRNEECWCGRGQKYKWCCDRAMRNDA